MGISIAIVDDSRKDREQLADILHNYASGKHLDIQLTFFESADALLKEYSPLLFTVIFMDIHMDGLTGIEAAQKIRESDVDTALIFLTESKECRDAAFRTHAFDYIEKPAAVQRIHNVMDDLLQRMDASLLFKPSLSFTSNRHKIELPYADITSVSSSNHYLDITDAEGTIYRTRLPFSHAFRALQKDSRFLLIIRGVIVNLDFVQDFENGTCHMKNGMYFPYSLRREKELTQIWQNFVLAKSRRNTLQRKLKD